MPSVTLGYFDGCFGYVWDLEMPEDRNSLESVTNEATDALAFGDLVKMRRKQQGYTQEALAASALGNMDRKGYISNVERGNLPKITPATVQKLCETLGIGAGEVPMSLRWGDSFLDTQQSARSQQSEVAPAQTQTNPIGGPTYIKQLAGVGLLIAVVALSDQLLGGALTIKSSIWFEETLSIPALFGWSVALVFLVFYFFGLEGTGAFARADWLERGTWRDRYIVTVTRMLAATDRWFLTPTQAKTLPTNAIGRNWSTGLYEKAWGFSVVYPSVLLMLQWVVTGSNQQLGFLQLWPEEPAVLRRVLLCLCFLVPVAMAFVARGLPDRNQRIAMCGLALVINALGTAYLWSVYWNVLAGAGAINMITMALVLGVGLRMFDSVAGAAAAGAVAGASLSFLFLPLVEVSEFLTGRAGLGYSDPSVNVVHTIINHSLNILVFLVVLRLFSKLIQPYLTQDAGNRAAMVYLIVSIGAVGLMIVASGQSFWFPYYFLIGLLPLVNALFDFLSIGLTRFALRLGLQDFGVKTIAFSLVDLAVALILFIGLILATAAVAVSLNWMVGTNAFPLQSSSAVCLDDFSSAMTAEAHSAVKGVKATDGLCSDPIIQDMSESPKDYLWLILIFGSTLLPTVLHLGLALFALGPAILGSNIRNSVASWARASAHDPFLRGAAALFFALWLSVVVTVTTTFVWWSGSLLGGVFWLAAQVTQILPTF